MRISNGPGYEGNRSQEIKVGNYVILYVANINPMNREKCSFHFPVINATAEDMKAIKDGKISLPPMSGLKQKVVLKVESIENTEDNKTSSADIKKTSV